MMYPLNVVVYIGLFIPLPRRRAVSPSIIIGNTSLVYGAEGGEGGFGGCCSPPLLDEGGLVIEILGVLSKGWFVCWYGKRRGIGGTGREVLPPERDGG